MRPLLAFIFYFSSFVSLRTQANDLFFSVNQEVQSFYLTPHNSSPYFGRSELLTKGELGFFENVKFKLDTSTSATFMKKQDQQSFLFNPLQLGLSLTSKYIEFFGGGFRIAGEGADLNNIFDVVNAADFRQPFNPKAIGSYGALITVPFDAFTFKGFYIPRNEKSLLPDTQSPWWPRTDALPIRNSSGTFLVPDNMGYKLNSQTDYKDPFANNYGATAKVSFSKIDFNFFYFKGVNQIPKISPNFNIEVTSYDPLIGVITPPVEINLTWFRSEHVGMGSTLVLGDWITKVFCKTQKDFLPTVEKSTSCTGTIESSVALSSYSLRYFLQGNRVWRQDANSQELETLLGFFEKSTALGIYLDMNTKGLLSGAVIYNEKDPSSLVSMSYEYRFTDQLKSKLTANVLTTSGSSPLGNAYDKTDNVSVALGYDF